MSLLNSPLNLGGMPAWAWGLALLSLPIIIHLINLLRHRRVQWAAMDFLLQSQKKNKRWIVFRQLLLLLLRIGSISAAIAMLARPVLQDRWSQLFGGSRTHHVVLLDDSFSMNDRIDEGTVFDKAKQAVLRLAQQAGQAGPEQELSLFRFSSATDLGLSDQGTVIQQPIDHQLLAELDIRLTSGGPSQTAATASEILDEILDGGRLKPKSDDENRIVYIVSDFRSRQWNEPTELKKRIRQLDQQGVQVNLVHCVQTARPNLAISALEMSAGPKAAGVSGFAEVTVTNYGSRTVRDVVVELTEDGVARPGTVIARISPGQSVTQRFTVEFGSTGPHSLTAALPADAVESDNRRYLAVDVISASPVLIVDGAADQRGAFFLSSALQPGGPVRLGVRPRVESPAALRTIGPLDRFASIWLVNVGRLDEPEIAAIEQYVAAGGGVGIFLGEQSDAGFITRQLYREGEGMFPAPLTLTSDLLPAVGEKTPDIDLGDHPTWQPFTALESNPIDEVLVRRYFKTDPLWQPEEDSGTKVLASLRGGAPLIVERRLGAGSVVAVLTKASPAPPSADPGRAQSRYAGSWNNWGRSPSFLLWVHRLHQYLASGRAARPQYLVGQPLALNIDSEQYTSQVVYALPADGTRPGRTFEATLKDDHLQAEIQPTAESGYYPITLTTHEGEETQQLFAYNVDAREGDLKTTEPAALEHRLTGLRYKLLRPEDLRFDPQQMAGTNISLWLLALLIAILLGEQLLAYSASYHPARRQGGSR